MNTDKTGSMFVRIIAGTTHSTLLWSPKRMKSLSTQMNADEHR